MFKAEQEQYTKEGVPWTSIDFVDNQACIHLIERPGGIMAMMDEEAKMPRGNDKTLMDKLSRKHRACPVFVFEDKFPDMFQVKHYASTVPYSIEGFMDKNKDTLQDDVSLAMVQSKLPLICELFTTNYDTPYPLSPRGSQPNLSRSQSSLDFKEISPPSSPFTNSGPKRPSSTLSRTATTGNIRRDSGRTVDSVSRLVVPQTNGRKSGFSLSLTGIENTGSPVSPRTPDMKGITVCRKFKYDLASLIEILASSNRHYIRCIKPNDYALPDTFDQLKIINQLRSNGILETVKLRQAGFSRRVPFTSFVDRYYVLGIQANQIAAFFNRPDLKETNNNKGGNDKIQWAIGKTQVFLRERFVQNLEKLRIKAYEKYVVVIQSTIKRQLSIQYLDKLKKEFQEKMERIVRIESRIRAWNATCAFMKLKMEDEAKRCVASVVLQKYIRYWNCQINKMKLMEKKGTNNGVAEEQRNNQIELKRKEQKRKMKEEEKNISLELLKIEQERSDMQLEKKRALEIERSKLEQNALLAAEEEKRRIIEEERRILQEERRKLEEERSKWTEEEKRREEMWRMEVQRQKDMYKQQELEQLEKKKIEINQLLEKEKSKLHKEELDLKNRHQLELQKLELERESLKGREEEMETKFKEEIELLRQEIMRVKEEANSAIKEQQLFNELERKHREEDWIRAQQEKLDIEKSKMMAQREEELRSQLHKLKAKKQKEKEKFAKERELQELQQAEWLKQQKSLIEEQFKQQQQHQQVNTSLVSKESTLTDEFRSTYNLIGKGVFVGGIGLALWGLTTIVNIISPRGGSYPNK
uniref:Myosin motor domain-containing protein n=1 Tax=Arcella intermedia TaxID=1963864 RepID=A0A6B2KXU3_9EUKA